MPNFFDPYLQIDTSQGKITIDKNGANINSSKLNIIAKDVEILGDIKTTKDIKVIAGQNLVEKSPYNFNVIQNYNSSNNNLLVVHGSMYGNNIKLINTNNNSNIQINGNLLSSNISMAGNSLINNGNILAKDQINLFGDKITNNNNLRVYTNLYTTGISIKSTDSLINTGNIDANNNFLNFGSLNSKLNLSLTANNIFNDGILQGEQLDITSWDGSIVNNGEFYIQSFGEIYAKKIIKLVDYSGSKIVYEFNK